MLLNVTVVFGAFLMSRKGNVHPLLDTWLIDTQFADFYVTIRRPGD